MYFSGRYPCSFATRSIAFLMFLTFCFFLVKSCVSYHVTINPHKIVNILARLVSNRLTLNSTVSNTQRDGEIVNMLLENVESILNSGFLLF